jgi:hypothetical protein
MRRHRERIVGRILPEADVVSTNLAVAPGSSIVFKSAFAASAFKRSARSIQTTRFRPIAGGD